MAKIEIINLADEPQHLETVAGWIFNEWEADSKKFTLDEVIYTVKNAMGQNTVPMTFIAKYDHECAGVISLWTNDLKTRQDLTPYGATFFVKKEFRGKGVDKALLAKIVFVTKELGYEYLYFWSHHKNYYERMKGVEYMEDAPLGFGEYVPLYRIRVSDL